jgi:hypothetical protein
MTNSTTNIVSNHAMLFEIGYQHHHGTPGLLAAALVCAAAAVIGVALWRRLKAKSSAE